MISGSIWVQSFRASLNHKSAPVFPLWHLESPAACATSLLKSCIYGLRGSDKICSMSPSPFINVTLFLVMTYASVTHWCVAMIHFFYLFLLLLRCQLLTTHGGLGAFLKPPPGALCFRYCRVFAAVWVSFVTLWHVLYPPFLQKYLWWPGCSTPAVPAVLMARPRPNVTVPTGTKISVFLSKKMVPWKESKRGGYLLLTDTCESMDGVVKLLSVVCVLKCIIEHVR